MPRPGSEATSGQLDVISLGPEGQQPDRDPVALGDEGVGVQDIDQRSSARLNPAAEVCLQQLARPRLVVGAVGADRDVAAHVRQGSDAPSAPAADRSARGRGRGRDPNYPVAPDVASGGAFR